MVENCNFLKNCPILKIDKNQKKCKKFQILNLTPTFDSRFSISMKFSSRKYCHLLSDQPKQVSFPCWLVSFLNVLCLNSFMHHVSNLYLKILKVFITISWWDHNLSSMFFIFSCHTSHQGSSTNQVVFKLGFLTPLPPSQPLLNS